VENENFGFQDHLKEEFPSQIIMDLTEVCNLQCIHCPHPSFKQSSVYTGKNLDLILHHKAIDEIGTIGKGYCQYVRYTSQGEPLLHPQAIEMIAYAGKHANCAINLTTNGMTLNQRKIDQLLDIGVDIIDISIDAFSAEIYAQIRVNGELSKTKNNVLNLLKSIKERKAKTKVVVSFVEQPLNTHEVNDFENFWKNAGAHFVVIRRLHSCAGSKSVISDLLKSKQSEKRRPCLYPWERLVISPNAMIGYCPADWKYQGKISHLSNSTIKEVWQSDFMKKLREAHLTNNFQKHSFCGNCPDWELTRWPWQGRSYSSMMKEAIPEDLLE
jgi:MoaA/NifB/PqqE/SkfB family radical SAM enzyme